MKMFRNPRQAWCILLAVCVVMTQVWIFSHSMRDAEDSLKQSDTVIEIVRPIVEPILQDTDFPPTYDNLSHLVRKCAHFAEYALLGFFCLFCIWVSPIKGRWRMLLSLPYCVLSACMDECIQLGYAERSGQWSDVLLDSCGALTGILFALLCLGIGLLIRKKRKKKQIQFIS